MLQDEAACSAVSKVKVRRELDKANVEERCASLHRPQCGAEKPTRRGCAMAGGEFVSDLTELASPLRNW